MSYSIWIVTLPGYPHSRCFEEVALGLQEAFKELGQKVPIVTDISQIQGKAIVLGANLLPHIKAPLPADMILYNLEQIETGSPWLQPAYLELLKQHAVWDYSERNIAALQALGIRATYCGVGYMPALTRIAPVEQDIDVLFVGSTNPRRIAVLESLAKTGKQVAAAFNSYGEARDALIARAKIVLNMHFYEAQVFEIVRVSYLLANHKCVVSETGLDHTLEAPFQNGIAFAPYEKLVDTCLHLLDAPEVRAQLATIGFERFQDCSQVGMLKAALAV